MDFTEQELLIERLDNWGRVYGERRAPGWRSSLKVARVDGKPARIYQKKVEPKDDEDDEDVPF